MKKTAIQELAGKARDFLRTQNIEIGHRTALELISRLEGFKDLHQSHALEQKRAPSTVDWVVHHELDTEPTYVLKKADAAGTDENSIRFGAGLDHEMRLSAARALAAHLNGSPKANPLPDDVTGELLTTAEEIISFADSTGCSDDLTVTSVSGVTRLESLVKKIRQARSLEQSKGPQVDSPINVARFEVVVAYEREPGATHPGYNPDSLEVLAADINDGDCIGSWEKVDDRPLKKAEVRPFLLSIGNDGTFFCDVEQRRDEKHGLYGEHVDPAN